MIRDVHSLFRFKRHLSISSCLYMSQQNSSMPFHSNSTSLVVFIIYLMGPEIRIASFYGAWRPSQSLYILLYVHIYIHEKSFTRFLLTLPRLLKTKTETFYFCVRIVRYFCMNDSAWQSLYDWEIWEFSFPAFVLLVLSEATTSRKSWKAISCCSNREKVCLCHVERRLLLI